MGTVGGGPREDLDRQAPHPQGGEARKQGRRKRCRGPHKRTRDLCRLSSRGSKALGAAPGTTLGASHPHLSSLAALTPRDCPQANEGTMGVCEQGHNPQRPSLQGGIGPRSTRQAPPEGAPDTLGWETKLPICVPNATPPGEGRWCVISCDNTWLRRINSPLVWFQLPLWQNASGLRMAPSPASIGPPHSSSLDFSALGAQHTWSPLPGAVLVQP